MTIPTPAPRPLCELLAETAVLTFSGPLDVPIQRVITDSRQVRPGDVFVCLPGYTAEGGESRADRHDYIPEALQRGVSALVVDREVAAPPGVAVVRVANCWQAAAELSCQLYGQPGRALTLIGITGTNGKTSTAFLSHALLRAAGRRVALLGTVKYLLGDEELPAPNTTPEAPRLQELLATARENRLDTVVMEVSSHALALHRVHGLKFDVAVYTNLTQDHLDFHPDMEAYREAKGRLFAALKAEGMGVINREDPYADYFIGCCPGRVLTYGRTEAAEVRAEEVHSDVTGLAFRAVSPAGEVPLRLQLLGEYNVLNALAAVAVGIAQGVDLETIRAGLEATRVPGRFEMVDAGQDFGVAVDYAHTPDALENVLREARKMKPRRLIVVFGCGGDRDRTKRPKMGRIAAEWADQVFITSDNPRTERPEAIVADIEAGLPADHAHCQTIVDRTSAIQAAIAAAGPGDLVIIAGKGHETYQILGHERIHFDDREVAAEALRHR